jgi:hypothetical protein
LLFSPLVILIVFLRPSRASSLIVGTGGPIEKAAAVLVERLREILNDHQPRRGTRTRELKAMAGFGFEAKVTADKYS